MVSSLTLLPVAIFLMEQVLVIFIENELQFCLCLCKNVQKRTKRRKLFSDLTPCMREDCPIWPAFHCAPWMAKKEGCEHCWKSVKLYWHNSFSLHGNISE